MIKIDKLKRNGETPKKGNIRKRQYTPAGFYYSLLTIVLLLCLAQITCGAVLNISKLVSYQAKMTQLLRSKEAAALRNKQLKDDISGFSAVTGLEAIARNNLKMASDDEVLVIINTKSSNEGSQTANEKHFKLDFINERKQHD